MLSLGAFREDCSEKTRLTRIAVNTCRDMRRSAWFRRIDRRITPETLPEPISPADEDVALTLAIMRLPQKLKKVMVSLLRRCSNNLNQIARRANETGRVYQVDVDGVMRMQQELWKGMNQLLTRLGSLS